jgi:extracellular factor (EF) 3-hydroxypalmitic acid methyl ester biosynthesis protein
MSTQNTQQNGVANGELKDSLVIGQTSQGLGIRATLLRLTRFAAVFEIYNPGFVLRASEVLSDFKIVAQGRAVYSGRAVVSKLIDTGSIIVCEATLDDCWLETNFSGTNSKQEKTHGFAEFLQQWQRIYKVQPEFKVIIADMQTFLTDMRLWLKQVELRIRSAPPADRVSMEREIAVELGQSTTPVLTNLFEKFENALESVDKESQPVYQMFARRQLHPLLLCSPFLYRTFLKPLGYAGDYEMVNMIMRDPLEGGSLYAKLVNLWFLQQAPAEAHRHRIDYLTEQIIEKARLGFRSNRRARILSLGCGPGHEVQKFLRDKLLANHAEFFLLDFNAETLLYTEAILTEAKKAQRCTTPVKLIKKSVNQILKEFGRGIERAPNEQYDLVYCAGLFDYLSDPVCRRISNVLYEWVAPGGSLITTNVNRSNPRQLTMEYIMEWHLIYRNGAEFSAMKPDKATSDLCSIKSDNTGVNIYLEAKNPFRA